MNAYICKGFFVENLTRCMTYESVAYYKCEAVRFILTTRTRPFFDVH